MIEEVTPKKCIEFAIATEELGTKFYRRLASRFGENKEISQVFAQCRQWLQLNLPQVELIEVSSSTSLPSRAGVRPSAMTMPNS